MSRYVQEITMKEMNRTHTQKYERTHLDYVFSPRTVLSTAIYAFLVMLDPVVRF
jgi:hypothetical protein